MKTVKYLFLILSLGLFINGCSLEPNHSIRIRNEYPETVKNLKVGAVSYSDVTSQSVTEYNPVNEGSHSLSGYTNSGQTLTGNVTVTGKGKHKWTIRILSAGTLEVKEDK